MKTRSDKWQVTGDKMAAMRESRSCHSSLVTRHAFTLIEVMVVVVLLSFIVLALMSVFNSTQTAFRASVTQSTVLEGGRAAMDLIATDLRELTPSGGVSNGPVNFYAAVPPAATPLVQPMVASSQQRTNVLENVFILSRDNTTWTGVGYAVYLSPTNLYSLYRFAMSTNVAFPPRSLFDNFTNAVGAAAWTNMSHLLDGVVGLTARAYDLNGVWMTNGYAYGYTNVSKNVQFQPPALGEVGFKMFSNTLPASVEISMGVLEDRALQRAESLSGSFTAQSNYLAQQAGRVHLFRQRVTIPNVAPSAYQ